MTFFKFFNLLLISTLLASCGTKRNPYFGSEEAQFKISTVRVISAQTLGHNSFDMVNKVRFDLNVCFQDLTGTALPPKLRFDVVVGKESVTRLTNEDGCLGWEREVGFDPMTKEKYYILKTTFVSKNELGGSIALDLALNPWTKDIKDLKKNPNAIPPGTSTEHVEDEGFKIKDITKSPQRNDTLNPQTESEDLSALPRSNLYDAYSGGLNTLKVSIPAAVLRRIRLHPETPYTVDEYLNLSTHEVYEFSANPKFYMQKIDSREAEVLPKSGMFRVTIAIVDEPDFDVDKMWNELSQFESLNDILTSKDLNPEVNELQITATKILSERRLSQNSKLNLDQKRFLMTRVMMPYVLQTTQFETKMKPHGGLADKTVLSFNRLALLRNRALLAYTVEPISPDIKQRIKADAVGHATIGIQGGWRFGVLHEMKLEADLIHNERLLNERNQTRMKPLDLFLETSKKALGSRAARLMESSDIPASEFMVHSGQNYSFQENFNKYVNKKLSKSEERKLLMALCYKAFVRPEFASIEKKQNDKTERLIAAFNCSDSINTFLNVERLDFVNQAPLGNMKKVGQVLNRTLTISRSIRKETESKNNVGVSSFLKASVGPFHKTSGFIVSIGHEVYYTNTDTVSEVQSAEAESHLAFRLNVEMTQFNIKYDSRKCLKMSYTDHVLNTMPKYHKQFKPELLPESLVMCSNEVVPSEKLEEYFIITEDCNEELRTTDCSAPEESRFRMVIRGKPVYEFFEKVILDSTKGLTFKTIPQSIVRHEVLSWDKQFEAFLTTQIFPGVFSK